MPSSHLILCCPLLLLPPIPLSIRVFSNESTLCMRWPKYWSFSFSISPSNQHPGLISFRMDWLDLLAVQGTLKSLLQHHSSKASIFRVYISVFAKFSTISIFNIIIFIISKKKKIQKTRWRVSYWDVRGESQQDGSRRTDQSLFEGSQSPARLGVKYEVVCGQTVTHWGQPQKAKGASRCTCRPLSVRPQGSGLCWTS